jgi:hypothetical protein
VDDSYPVLLKRGLAQDLATAELGVYKPVGAYTATDVATLPGIKTDGPGLPLTFDRALVLTTLTPFMDGRFDQVTPVQIRTRVVGGRTDAENLMEAIRDRFHGRSSFALGTLTFQKSLQVNSLYIDDDGKGRCGYFQTIHFVGRRIIPRV